MPSVRIKATRQSTAVYWPPSTDEFNADGSPAFGTAVEVPCRWRDDVRTVPQNDQTVVEQAAVVYPDISVVEPVQFGYMVEGTLAGVPNVNDPVESGAYQIFQLKDTQSIVGQERFYKVWIGQWQG